MIESVPVNIPLLCGNEKKYLDECIDSGWISSEGPFIDQFESRFSHYIGRLYGIAVSSGTAALDIAVKAIGIQPGDEVIMPTFTIISPALSLIKAGAIPVFADSDPATWNVDVTRLEALITPRTRAILVVHIYGLPANMEVIAGLAKKYKLSIIEDAAQMHGQTCHGKKCGSFGDISIFSFYPNKHITTGEGGMILCDSPELAQRCRKLRNLGFEPDRPRFVHYEAGWNYRMTNMQAAVGVAQLEQIDQFLERKRLMGAFYQNELGFLKDHGYQLPLLSTDYADNIYWVFGLLAPDPEEKSRLIRFLNGKLIGNRPFFWCMHEQPVFQNEPFYLRPSFPVAEKMARCGFYIPSGLGLTERSLTHVARTMKSFYE